MTPTPAEIPKSPTFESALSDLEQIVRALETGDISLEDALAKYEAGVGMLKHCYNQLRQAEQRIVLLAGEDPEGKPLVQPFDHAPALKTSAPRPGKRTDSSY